MEFKIQLAIAAVVACAIGIPIAIVTYNKRRKEGKSIKYWEFKIAIIVGLPILSVPFILSDELSIIFKIFAICMMFLSMVAYGYSVSSSRKAFRKILGLPPEDEDTGQIIKEDREKT